MDPFRQVSDNDAATFPYFSYPQNPSQEQSLVPSRPRTASAHSSQGPARPSDDAIEAVIQMATSSRASSVVPNKDTRTQLFVGNLPYRVRWQDLKDLFRRAGTVLRADVSLGPDNRSRGYGTVLLATAEDAGRAVDMFNGYSWQTRILEVRLDRMPPLDFDNPLSSGMNMNHSLHPLQQLHSSAGSSFSTPTLDDLDVSALLQYQLQEAAANTPLSGSPSRNLFVGNLPFHCQWQDLKDLFRQAGTIMRADVALGPDGRSRGFGTVAFSTEHDAERAVKMFNGYEYNGRVLKVHYDKFSLLGQLPTPSSQLNAQAILSQPRPQIPSSLQFPFSGRSGDLPPPSPFDVHIQRTPSLSQQQTQSQASSALSSMDIHPPRPHPLQQVSRAGSSSASSASGSSNPTSFDMESIATSLSSMTNYTSASGPSSMPAVPTKRSSSPATLQTLAKEKQAVKSLPVSPPRPHSSHPHHPGTITLPPPPPLPAFPMSSAHPNSHGVPHHSPHHPPSHSQYHLTPHGLPPITPSMPAFMFYPPPQHSPHGAPSPHMMPMHLYQHAHTPTGVQMVYPMTPPMMPLPTPPMHPGPYNHPLSTPPLHMNFSPMSPGAFWAGGSANPFINPTVGAPVRMASYPAGHTTPSGGGGGGGGGVDGSGVDGGNNGAGYYNTREPSGYFDIGYFPPVPPSNTTTSSDFQSSSIGERGESQTRSELSGGAGAAAGAEAADEDFFAGHGLPHYESQPQQHHQQEVLTLTDSPAGPIRGDSTSALESGDSARDATAAGTHPVGAQIQSRAFSMSDGDKVHGEFSFRRTGSDPSNNAPTLASLRDAGSSSAGSAEKEREREDERS